MLTRMGEVLHATEALHCFYVTCYISVPGSPLRLKSIKRLEEGNDSPMFTDGGLEQMKAGLEFWIVKTQIEIFGVVLLFNLFASHEVTID